MAIGGALPEYLTSQHWLDKQAVSRDIGIGVEIVRGMQQRQQQERVLRLREEHFRLQREELERIAEGTVAASSVFSEMGNAGDYTNPELQSKFWATVQKYPKFTQSPAFKDMVDTLQSAEIAKKQMDQITTRHDLRSEELDQRHDNRLIELDRQYENMLSRQDLAHESRIEIEKLRQQLQVERDALKPTTQRPERFDLDESDRIDYAARVEGLKEWLKAQPTNKKNPDAPYQQYTEKLNALNKEFEPRKKKRTVGQPIGGATKRVKVKSADGRLFTLPENQLQDAIKQGYTLAE